MSIKQYKKVFSEYHLGSKSFIHLLSKPVAPVRDIALHQDDLDALKQVVSNADKRTNAKLVFMGENSTDKSYQLNHLAYQTKQVICFIDCQLLVDKYIGETEKNVSHLIAQASAEQWILFFDEADALFAKHSDIKHQQHDYANQQVSYLFKRLSLYPGLSIFSLTKKSQIENIEHMVDRVIYFR